MFSPLAITFEVILRVLDKVPLRIRYWLVHQGVKLWLQMSKKHLRVAQRNIDIVFFDQSPGYKEKIMKGCARSLAELIVDACRAPFLDEEWMRSHFSNPDGAVLDRVQVDSPGKGILFLTAHLGSFELAPHVLPFFGFPFYVSYNPFRPESIDKWIQSRRERRGCRTLKRTGSVPEMARLLSSGRNVVIIADQNVKSSYAVFEPFFGKVAACSRAVALLALRSGSPVVVGSVENTAFDTYRFHWEHCPIESIRNDSALSLDEKIQAITRVLNGHLERLILRQPERWFWFHRRWRTRPPGDQENPYA